MIDIMLKKLKTRMKALSLVETVFTLAIFAILLVMLSEVLVLNIRASNMIKFRSSIRDELSELTSLIQRDIRNAGFIDIANCDDDIDIDSDINNESACRISHRQNFYWVFDQGGELCPENKLCKINTDLSGEVYFQTAEILSIDSINFEVSNSNIAGDEVTVLITIVASATNENWDIDNQIRQISVATRNF